MDKMTGTEKYNHLSKEKSPYLRQHAKNPVDWYPWGDEAFRKASDEDKPVFLSIGYSTCHWCHVMARESFENADVARVLNRHFIAVKVDREERPDIDSIFMTVCQQMTGTGGWPLTIIMTPDKLPFFAGTYIPPHDRAGMYGLTGLLEKVAQMWSGQKDLLVSAGGQQADLLRANVLTRGSTPAGLRLSDEGFSAFAASFDACRGGFGRAPKFPSPSIIRFLFRYWKRTGSVRARDMALRTLDAIMCGGIHDHIGGGFHRYATDAAWQVPHFEKMLYDQALLLDAYTEAWQVTRRPEYRAVAEEIIRYVCNDLRSPEKAFFSAEDADSEGDEGLFYLWTSGELIPALGKEDADYASAHFRVTTAGNFHFSGSATGYNILSTDYRPESGTGQDERLESIKETLRSVRSQRPRPAMDNKVLTDWNALVAGALARASRVFDNPEYFHAAEETMRFILRTLRTSDGGLLHRYCDGEAAVDAFADDYAFVIYALIELYQASSDPYWMNAALELTHYMNDRFTDRDNGGYFFTADNGEEPIVRKKEVMDGATPSSNAVMLNNLVLLAHLTGDPLFLSQAAALADSLAGNVSHVIPACASFLSALEYHLGTSSDIVIAGDDNDPEMRSVVRMVNERFLPFATMHVVTKERAESICRLAPYTCSMKPGGGKVTVYLCTDQKCTPPVTGTAALEKLLEKM